MTTIFKAIYWTFRKWKPLGHIGACWDGAWRYAQNQSQFTKQLPRSQVKLKNRPCFGDASSHTKLDPHYLYQAIWAHETLKRLNPPKHVDVGSDLRWISLEQTERKIVFVDIRPPDLTLSNVECIRGSINELPFPPGTVASLSCMHVIEHIGLGRYGDTIDVDGSRKAAIELMRVMAPGSRLLLSTPVGQPAIYFDAHRVHAPAEILSMFKDLTLEEFSFVADDGTFKANVTPSTANSHHYACGMFLFQKAV